MPEGTMTMADGHQAQAPVKERILTAATRLFAEHGYAGASTAQIVEAAAITKPMLYYYYGDKESLYMAAVERLNDQLGMQLQGLGTAGSARDRMVEVARALFQFHQQHPAEGRLQFAAYYGPDRSLGGKVEQGGFLMFEAFFRAIEHGLAAGQLAGDPMRLAVSVMGIIMLHIMGAQARPEVMVLSDDIAAELIDHYVEGVRAR